MDLNWMPVSEPYYEAAWALMPGRMVKHGLIAHIGNGEVFVAMWPSVPPEHIDDFVTLTLTVDDEVIKEIRRYASYDAAKAAAQEYVKGLGERRPGGY